MSIRRAPYPPPGLRPGYATGLRPGVAAGGSSGAGALGGVLGGLGGALTCLCCLSALGLIGLWVTFIPFVAFFKYAYDQDVRAYGAGPSIQNLQQIVLLVALCLLTIGFVKRQVNT